MINCRYLLLSVFFVFFSGISYPTVLAQSSSLEILANTVDQTYLSLTESMPRLAKTVHRVQDRFWTTMYGKIEKKLQKSKGDDIIIYEALLVKIDQRSQKFQFNTKDIIIQQEVLNQVNDLRKSLNLNSLKFNLPLSLAAYTHASDMNDHFPNAAGEVLSHIGSDGSTVKDRVDKVGYSRSYLGENIARNQITVGQVIKEWMDSPAHKENILSDKYTDIGIAKVGPYRVQDFGKPRNNR